MMGKSGVMGWSFNSRLASIVMLSTGIILTKPESFAESDELLRLGDAKIYEA